MPVQRYATIGVLALAAIVAAVLAHATAWGLSAAALPNPSLPLSRELCASNALGLSVAFGIAWSLRRNAVTRRLCDEVVEELLRVSWPRREDVVRATGVVIATVAVCSVYLGFLDALWLWVTDALLGIGQEGALAGGLSAR